MVKFRRDWLDQMDNMQREVERLLDHFAGSKPPLVQRAKRVWEPAIDVYETDNDIVIFAELAGVSGGDIEILVDSDRLTLRGIRKNPGLGTKRTYYQMEIADGPFERTLSLPVTIDLERVKATCSGGLLKITLPKAREEHMHAVSVRVVRVRRSS